MLCFGTQGGGVNKMIPRDFWHVRTNAEGEHGITSSSVRAIHEDRSGALWAGTSGAGIVVFDRDGISKEYRPLPLGKPPR
jgi:ligand-binding sensor domain-containing protein